MNVAMAKLLYNPIKIFGAAWLGYAGSAGRRSEDFIPSLLGESAKGNGGRVFNQIGDLDEFGADDLLAADHLFWWGKQKKFGGRGVGINRSYTRYLFYYTYIQLVRTILAVDCSVEEVPTHLITRATLKLYESNVFDELCDVACQIIDRYIYEHSDAPIRRDAGFKQARTIEVFFKSERLDAANLPENATEYLNLLGQHTAGMTIRYGQFPPVIEKYRDLLNDCLVTSSGNDQSS